MAEFPLRAKGLAKTTPACAPMTSFAVESGTIHALLGENGAGKSTLVKMVHGLVRPDEGRMWLEGRPYVPADPRAAIGTIAGRMTRSNRIGYIRSFPIPEVVQGINSAFIHARKVNPDVEMKVVWAYTWFDPAKEADVAAALIAEGVDVLMQHTDSTAPLAKAQEAGAFAFGQASDMANFKPTPRISSIIDDWAPYYIERVGAALDGT